MTRMGNKQRYIYGGMLDGAPTNEHIRVAEKALGRKLRKPEEVHHADGDPFNNDPSNLVICPDRAYHMLLHIRLRAFLACGNPNYRLCSYCKEYDDPENNMRNSAPNNPNGRYIHRGCHAHYNRVKQKLARRLL